MAQTLDTLAVETSSSTKETWLFTSENFTPTGEFCHPMRNLKCLQKANETELETRFFFVFILGCTQQEVFADIVAVTSSGFLCAECNRKFKTKGSVMRHIRERHLNTRDVQYSCCNATFSLKRYLCDHIKRFHPKWGDVKSLESFIKWDD